MRSWRVEKGKRYLEPPARVNFHPSKVNWLLIMEEEICVFIVETPRSAGRTVRLLWVICLVILGHEKKVNLHAGPRQRSLMTPTNAGLSLTSGYPVRCFFTVRQCWGTDIRVLRYGVFRSVRWTRKGGGLEVRRFAAGMTKVCKSFFPAPRRVKNFDFVRSTS